MGLSILIGSSLFVLNFATALVVLVSPNEIRLKKRFFLRDSIFLLIALSTLLFDILVRGQISLLSSALFVCEYAVYVLFVIVQNRFSKDKKGGGPAELHYISNNTVELSETNDNESHSSSIDQSSPESMLEGTTEVRPNQHCEKLINQLKE